MKLHQLPNILTVFRFLLVPPVVMLMLKDEFMPALVLFAVAGIGGLMDPLADKLLMVSSYLTLGWLGLIPLWLVGLVILRDLVIVTGAIIYNARIEHIEAEPSIVSKLNTLAQILLVLSVLFNQAFMELPAWWIDLLVYSVLVTIVWSGVGYVWTWSRRAWTRSEH